MQLVYEIGQTEGVRAIPCLHENTVTGAADGYGRMAGKPAFTLPHVGSGFANGIVNIQNAGRASRATTAEEFHEQFKAAMGAKGPCLIEAKIVQNLQPVIDLVNKTKG